MPQLTDRTDDVRLPETQWTVPDRPVSRSNQDACLVHIYPTGQNMGARRPLGPDGLLIGRSDTCALVLAEQSVSRVHARIESRAEGYYVFDLQSTNGTFVNDRLISASPLKDGDYLRIGNCIFRFLAGGNVEADYHNEIYRLTIIDALTDIHNKRYLVDFLQYELARSVRHHRPLSLVLFDIDHFKKINDQYGHLTGDYTLRELAACVRKNLRELDLFARYGGEEFALVLTETSLDGARQCAEQIRTLVQEQAFQFDKRSFKVTISLGIASTMGEQSLTPTEFIALADAKLYLAKKNGRNRFEA